MTTSPYATAVHVVNLDTILYDFAKDFLPSDPTSEVIKREWFVDQSQGKAVFVITTKKVD